jgi:hypothetical protein
MSQGFGARRTGAALTCVALLLSACGGGGSGGSAPVSLGVTSSTVSVVATTSDAAPSAAIDAQIMGAASTQYYFSKSFTSNGIAAIASTGNGATSQYTVQFKVPSSLTPGTYKDTVTITACYDSACQQQVPNSPQTVAVSYVVNESAGVAPQITALGPGTVNAGGAAFLLVVSGSNFDSSSTVQWNGSVRGTTFLSSTQLEVEIGASDIATAGSAVITVANFEPTVTLVSNASTFTMAASSTPAAMPPATPSINVSFDTSLGGGPILYNPFAVVVNGGPTNATYYYSMSFTGSAVAALLVNGSSTYKSGTTVPSGPAAGRITGEPSPGEGGQVTGSFTGSIVIVSQLAFVTAAQLGAGTYTDTISVSVCADALCTQPLPGSPLSIPVTYSVTGSVIPNTQFSLQISSFTLEATSSRSAAASATAVIDSNGLPPYGAYVFTTVGGGPVLSGSSIQSNLDGTATLTVTTKLPAALGPGVYTDSVQVNICFDAACTKPAAHFPVTLPITYIVDAAAGVDFNQATIPLEVNDMAWSATTQRIYATANSDTGGIKGSLVVINPMTASIEQVISLGQSASPTSISISDDDQFAYIIDNVAQTVVRMNLSTLTVDETVPVAQINGYSLKVAPGHSNSFAVQSYNNYTTLHVFDGAIERAQTFSSGSLEAQLFYTWGADANTIYAYDSIVSSPPMYQLSVSSNGLAVANTTPGVALRVGNINDLQYSGGLIYSTTASVYNPSSHAVQAPFALLNSNYSGGEVNSFAFSIDGALHRGYFLTTDTSFGTSGQMTIQAFNLSTQQLTWLARFPAANPEGGRLLRWGTNGLAFPGGNAGGPNVTLISGSVVGR